MLCVAIFTDSVFPNGGQQYSFYKLRFWDLDVTVYSYVARGQHVIFPKYLRKKSGYLLLPCVGNSFIFGSLVGAYYLQAVFMLGELFCAD